MRMQNEKIFGAASWGLILHSSFLILHFFQIPPRGARIANQPTNRVKPFSVPPRFKKMLAHARRPLVQCEARIVTCEDRIYIFQHPRFRAPLMKYLAPLLFAAAATTLSAAEP